MLRAGVGMLLAVLTITCAAAVAWANGANDVSKGVATLVGSRLASYRRGLEWGTLWTVAGAIAALALTTTMLRTFSTGLVGGSFATSVGFPLAVAVGAFLWVLLASLTGLPVSTTHSLTGAILGTAIAASGPQGVRWTLAFKTVAAPLAFSPIAAGAIAYVVHAFASHYLSTASRYCVCVREKPLVIVPESPGDSVVAARAVILPLVVVDEARACAGGETLSGLRVTDAAHWMMSAALSFARGLNDTPKIGALATAAAATIAFTPSSLYVVIAFVIGAGSLLSGRRVTETLAERVADIDPLEGLVASAVAAALVLAASCVALPVSTTHVASGAIVGVGLRAGSRGVQWPTVSSMIAAWLVTLPASAVFAAVAWKLTAWL
jgi:PiT family inorganic phosphate transporter